ncbi:MAG: hypothetical protein MRERV_5c005 [Mycoplasmataceae bacterium RV_VA103A]|nr:MAG: hypothetical protein MRERV_67c005 [Mycoplasmataceae bacterium RV_VA103A]KLL05083.1 MAG: hypothetical protein MRERV_5c005 [Mycoplasmataceae bacterium RV_VA103A]
MKHKHHDKSPHQLSQKNNCLYLKRGLYNAIFGVRNERNYS